MKLNTKEVANDFQQWLETSQAGDSFVYHKGFLAKDCQDTSDRELITFARNVLTLAEGGTIIIVQQKLGIGNYKYIATKA